MPRSATPLAQPLRLIFASNIRFARIHAGNSQEELAATAGLDRAFVGTLERGTRNISIDNIELIASAISIPAHELLDPQLASKRGFDVTLKRAPRKKLRHAAERRKKTESKR